MATPAARGVTSAKLGRNAMSTPVLATTARNTVAGRRCCGRRAAASTRPPGRCIGSEPAPTGRPRRAQGVAAIPRAAARAAAALAVAGPYRSANQMPSGRPATAGTTSHQSGPAEALTAALGRQQPSDLGCDDDHHEAEPDAAGRGEHEDDVNSREGGHPHCGQCHQGETREGQQPWARRGRGSVGPPAPRPPRGGPGPP